MGETAEFPWGDCDVGGGVLTPSEGGNWAVFQQPTGPQPTLPTGLRLCGEDT